MTCHKSLIIRHTDKHHGLIMTLLCSLLHSVMRAETDGCYQVHYLPASLSYTVDKNIKNVMILARQIQIIFLKQFTGK